MIRMKTEIGARCECIDKQISDENALIDPKMLDSCSIFQLISLVVCACLDQTCSMDK